MKRTFVFLLGVFFSVAAFSQAPATNPTTISATSRVPIYFPNGTLQTVRWDSLKAFIIAGLSGGSGVTGTGTTNKVTKWTSSSAIGNSSMSDDGSTVQVTTSGQNPMIWTGGLHSGPTVRASSGSGNSGFYIENSGDGNNSYSIRRESDGSFLFARSTSQPYSADDDSLFSYQPSTGVFDFHVTKLYKNGVPIGSDNLGNHTATQDLNMGGFDVLAVKPETYDATGWNGDNSAPTKNDVRDKIEAVISSIPTTTDKVTKGGDTDGAALTLGTNDGFDVNIERNNTTEVTIGNGAVDFTNDILNNVAGINATNINPSYSTYSTTGTNLSSTAGHYVTALGATTTMTVTTGNFADKAIFYVKNLSSVNSLIVAAGAGLTTNGSMYVPPNQTGWFQRVGTVVESLGGTSREYIAQLNQATDNNGVYAITHPFGTSTIKFASISITSTTEPYLWTIYSFGNGVVNFQVWNPTTGLPLALPNKVITVCIKI